MPALPDPLRAARGRNGSVGGRGRERGRRRHRVLAHEPHPRAERRGPLRRGRAGRRERGPLEGDAAPRASSTHRIRRASSRAPSGATSPRTPAARTRSSTGPPPTTCWRSSWSSPNGDVVAAGFGDGLERGLRPGWAPSWAPRERSASSPGRRFAWSRFPRASRRCWPIFADVVTACRAVGEIIETGLVPAALEIIDRRTIAAVEASVYAAGLPLDAGAVLIVELDGPAVALPAQVEAGARDRSLARGSDARRGRPRRRRAPALLAGAQGGLRGHGASGPGSLRARCRRAARAAARGDREGVRDRRPLRPHALQRLPRRRRESPPQHLLRPPRPRRARARDRGRGRDPRDLRRRPAA